MAEAAGLIGIVCPKCHCADLRTTHTRRLPGGRVRRYKRCRHCDRVVTTIEAPPGISDATYGTFSQLSNPGA